MTHPIVAAVTNRIIERSAAGRADYLDRIGRAAGHGPARGALGCANLAHGYAACGPMDKLALRTSAQPNIAIVTSYNDMLSAHQPFEAYPAILKKAISVSGGVAQVAGGVPAMCDGITQGRAGMELSLFSRDVIAMSTALALSHDMFDGALLLGVCDKIVPGLVIGALSFGHLPTMLVPAGPMPSGLPNAAKSLVRQRHAEGKAGREELLAAESASYHAPGTCTFYGTANSNQVLMEVMGLHLPGSSFINPGTDLRKAVTEAAGRRIVELTRPDARAPIGEVVDERAIVNGVVALLATGGSTNHTMHLIAIAAAAGISLRWGDFSDLSAIVPSLTRIYPNGTADVNHFHSAGGTTFLIGELIDAGLLHGDAKTVAGGDLTTAYRREPVLADGGLTWQEGPKESRNKTVLRGVADPFAPDGGLRMISGSLGRAVIKISAVETRHRFVTAPARVFYSQAGFLAAFQAGELNRDVVAVLRYQGPKANGMPELHKLTPALGVLQDRGHAVALVTDGRMSGASGKVPAAIHLTPEAADGGPIARVHDGDVVCVDAESGTLNVLIDPAVFAARPVVPPKEPAEHVGTGRELFSVFRATVGSAETGASVFAAPTVDAAAMELETAS